LGPAFGRTSALKNLRARLRTKIDGSCRTKLIEALAPQKERSMTILNLQHGLGDESVRAIEGLNWAKETADSVYKDYKSIFLDVTTRCQLSAESLALSLFSEAVVEDSNDEDSEQVVDKGSEAFGARLESADNNLMIQASLQYRGTEDAHHFFLHKVSKEEIYVINAYVRKYDVYQFLNSDYGKKKWNVDDLWDNLAHILTKRDPKEHWLALFGVDSSQRCESISGIHRHANTCDKMKENIENDIKQKLTPKPDLKGDDKKQKDAMEWVGKLKDDSELAKFLATKRFP